MPKLTVFNHVTLDGYFTDANGDMRWAHQGSDDPEFQAWVEGNAAQGGQLLFGRVTYDLMASYWPTPMAAKNDSAVAERMNAIPKIVFSRTLDQATWSNTRLIKADLGTEVRKLKAEPGADITILGSGTIVSQLAQLGLIDVYQLVVNPIALGKGRTLFDGLQHRLPLKLTNSRTFRNGKVLLTYEP